MDRILAEQLLPLVNPPHLQEALKAYAEYRIALAHKQIASAVSPQDLGKIQGQLIELQRLLSLRAECNGQR